MARLWNLSKPCREKGGGGKPCGGPNCCSCGKALTTGGNSGPRLFLNGSFIDPANSLCNFV